MELSLRVLVWFVLESGLEDLSASTRSRGESQTGFQEIG
jgi:hypothetical protein